MFAFIRVVRIIRMLEKLPVSLFPVPWAAGLPITWDRGHSCPPTYHIFTIIVSPKSSYQPLSLFPMAMG
jgi:hypothetical protein